MRLFCRDTVGALILIEIGFADTGLGGIDIIGMVATGITGPIEVGITGGALLFGLSFVE